MWYIIHYLWHVICNMWYLKYKTHYVNYKIKHLLCYIKNGYEVNVINYVIYMNGKYLNIW